MNEVKRIENKKSDKKALKIFIPVIIVSAIIGFFMGYFGDFVEANLADVIANGVTKALAFIAPYVNLVINVLVICICTIIIGEAKKKISTWDGENEEEYKKIDNSLSVTLMLSNLAFILSCFFFAVGFEYTIGSDNAGLVAQIICLVGYLLTLVQSMVISAKVVNTYKELNPEKQGSVYAMDFGKQWEKSCDEAEKLVIYKAAYGAYKFCGTFYMIVWLFCVFGNEVWHFGIMPATIITLVWLVNFISYQAYGAYYSKNPNKV